MKISILALITCFTLGTASYAITANAAHHEGDALGKELYKPCMSCHKDMEKAFGKLNEQTFIQKVTYIRDNEANSNPAKKMKELFQKMSDKDIAALANYATM